MKSKRERASPNGRINEDGRQAVGFSVPSALRAPAARYANR